MQTVLVDTDVAIDFLRGVSYSKQLLKGFVGEKFSLSECIVRL